MCVKAGGLSIGTRRNFLRLVRHANEGELAVIVCSLWARPTVALCALQDPSDSRGNARYIPLAILVNEYTTDLLNDLVPPPTLHGEWCWTYVLQKKPPSPLVPSEGDAEEGSEPA